MVDTKTTHFANAAIDFQRKKRACAVKRLEGFGMGRIAAAESTAVVFFDSEFESAPGCRWPLPAAESRKNRTPAGPIVRTALPGQAVENTFGRLLAVRKGGGRLRASDRYSAAVAIRRFER